MVALGQPENEVISKSTLMRVVDINSYKDGDCLLWLGPKHKERSPRLRVNGVRQPLVRMLFEASGNSLSKGDRILHSCKNSTCCNVDHMYISSVKTRSERDRWPAPTAWQIERFKSRYKRTASDECHEWLGPVDYSGFGKLRVNSLSTGKIVMYAHRLSYFLANQHEAAKIASLDYEVRHSCHNKLCLNPEHLFIVKHKRNK